MIVSLSICALKKQLNDNGNQAEEGIPEEDNRAGEDNRAEEDSRAGEDIQDAEGIPDALQSYRNSKSSLPPLVTTTRR